MTDLWQEAGEEPTVEDLLNDPIARLLRARDGLRKEDIRLAIDQARRHLFKAREAA